MKKDFLHQIIIVDEK